MNHAQLKNHQRRYDIFLQLLLCRNVLSICDESHVLEVIQLQRHMTCMYICDVSNVLSNPRKLLCKTA